MRTFAPLAILCGVAVAVPFQASSPTISRDKPNIEQVSFQTDDGAIIYADLYGTGTRGVVLAHGGRFRKESWRPQAQLLVDAGFRVLAFDFRGFGESHGPGDSDMFTAPTHRDVLAAVRYLRGKGAKTVAVIGGSFGGAAAADASVAARPGEEIDRLVLLAASSNQSAAEIKVPLLEIVARDDANDAGLRLPGIRAWFDKVQGPKQLIVLDGNAHAQFLFQTDQADRVMEELLRFLSASGPSLQKHH